MELSRTLVHCPAHSETHSDQRERRGLREVGHLNNNLHFFIILNLNTQYIQSIPATLSSAAADDGLLLDT